MSLQKIVTRSMYLMMSRHDGAVTTLLASLDEFLILHLEHPVPIHAQEVAKATVTT